MSPLALHELIDKLKRLDVDALVEILRLSSDEIVEAFSWKVEESIESLEKLIDDYE